MIRNKMDGLDYKGYKRYNITPKHIKGWDGRDQPGEGPSVILLRFVTNLMAHNLNRFRLLWFTCIILYLLKSTTLGF